LAQNEPVEIYPFVWVEDVFRPSDTSGAWKPDLPQPLQQHVIFVSSRIKAHLDESLLFVKLFRSSQNGNQLSFCGIIPFRGDEVVLQRVHHLRRLCGLTNTLKIQILKVCSRTSYCWVDVSATFKEQKLGTGSVVVLQEGSRVSPSREPVGGLVLGPYGVQRPGDCTSRSSGNAMIGEQLYRQALVGKYTDVVISNTQEDYQFRFTAHKNVLGTVPYFKAVFESGMKGNNVPQANPSVIELEAPPWADSSTLKEFLSYIYFRNPSLLSDYTIGTLSALIRLGDYYSFDELVDAASASIEQKYSWLTDGNAIELSKTLDPLQFQRKAGIEGLLVTYMVCNFPRVARRAEFRDLFGTDLYHSVIDGITEATLRKEDIELCA